MSKINLLTIHWGQSYGAVMQTYATCKMLESAGHDVTVINLSPQKAETFFSKCRSCLYLIKKFQFYLFKRRYFSKMTRPMNKISADKLPDADYLVIGSDQVWNPDITREYILNFFGDFVPGDTKVLSLSSSFGKKVWAADEQLTKQVFECINKFTAVSVRESCGVDICKNIFSVEAVKLCDPTLAYAQFCNLVKGKGDNNEIYPFLFRNSQDARDIVCAISEMYQLPIFKNSRVKEYLQSGPIDWIRRIYNSSVVITDSFHGLVFSILFKKNFYVLCADSNKFNRLQSLLEMTGLTNRIVRSLKDFKDREKELIESIDYTTVLDVLAVEQINFKKFIKQNIQ